MILCRMRRALWLAPPPGLSVEKRFGFSNRIEVAFEGPVPSTALAMFQYKTQYFTIKYVLGRLEDRDTLSARKEQRSTNTLLVFVAPCPLLLSFRRPSTCQSHLRVLTKHIMCIADTPK